MEKSVPELARLIDHTLLKPEATPADVAALVAEALELGVFAVCVSPTLVAAAVAARGRGSDPAGLRVASVVGFPSGAHAPEIKAREAALAVAAGADEIDMVVDLGHRGELDAFAAAVYSEVLQVREAVPGALLKVILESAVLSEEEIVAACEASERAGADFVKTSTGFHPAGGATAHAVALMRATVGDRLGVKASGGIRDRATAEAMVAAGATRLGLSSSRAVLAASSADAPGASSY